MSNRKPRTVYKDIPVRVYQAGDNWIAESLVVPYAIRPGKTYHLAMANLTNLMNSLFSIENRPYRARLVEVD